MASDHLLKPILSSALALFVFLLLNISSLCHAVNLLSSNQKLKTGASLKARSGRYVLTMQQDCDLVLYDSGSSVWATHTGGLASNCSLALQPDGNLVIQDTAGSAIWASNTIKGRGYYVLILQTDRNLVVYGPAVWASASNAPSSIAPSSDAPQVITSDDVGLSGKMAVVKVATQPLPFIRRSAAKNIAAS